MEFDIRGYIIITVRNNQVAEKEVLTCSIQSEMFTTVDSEPPSKLYISQAAGGERTFHAKSPKQKTEFVHKIRSPKHRSQEPVEKGRKLK